MKMTFLLAAALAVTACGGKILDEGPPGSAPASSATVTAPPPEPPPALPPTQPSPPPPVASAAHVFEGTVIDVCNVTCTTRLACGAGGALASCIDGCISEMTLPPCAAQGEAFWRCDAYGKREPGLNEPVGCGGLDPACEESYCALRACLGESLPEHCAGRR